MARVLIIYFSVYGTTKQYAEWIAEELNGDIINIKEMNTDNLINYDTIILGSGLYAGQIKGIQILIDNYKMIQEKKIVIFTCGLADYSKTENKEAIHKRFEHEIPADILQKIKIFYLRGGINYKRLRLKHKIMMGLLKKMTQKKALEEITDENKLFLETYGKEVDFMNKENIKEVIEYCRI